MAETKRKKTGPPAKFKKGRGGNDKKWKKGPNLPNMLKKEVQSLNPSYNSDTDNDDDEIEDLYEYEEGIPEEESKKNRRYDPVDNFEYQLPKDFQDEDIASDDEDEDEEQGGFRGGDDNDNDDNEDQKHSRMLQDITGLPVDAFQGKKKRNDVIISEAYPESEYNPSRDVLDGDGRITVDDLLNPLHGKPGFTKIRKDVQRMDRNSMSIQPPLPKIHQQKIDRKTAYGYSKKKLTEFEEVVKKNRQATTIYFDEDTNTGYSTIGAIASDFKPRTEFEKKMHSLINIKEISDAHRLDGAKLLELNKVSVEDVKKSVDQRAKFKAMLFRHEVECKRTKKIKSKLFRRLLKKDKFKAGYNEIEMDPEAAKELAEKQEFKRAQERMTLKHKNTSKWAKRAKKRGFDVLDDGTRAAISEQLQQHALLTQKRNSMHDDDDDDTSDDSMDDDDEEDISGDDDDAKNLKMLEKGKKKILEVINAVDETPKSGLFSLPFMDRGLKKRKAAADEEARLALQEIDSSIKQVEGDDDDLKDGIVSVGGRKVFGAQKKKVQKSNKIKVNRDNYFDNTDSENENDADTIEDDKMDFTQKDVTIDPDILRDESEVGHDPLFKSFEDLSKNSGPKIEYDVSLFPTNSSKKKKRNVEDNNQVKSEKKAKINKSQVSELVSEKVTDIIEDGDDGSDSDNEARMVDGILTSGTDYELPSQEDLIKRAFAGDDVEEDFEMAKQEILNEENPEPEKPVLLPGWGQWTHVQKRRGPPSWMLAEHERAKKKRDEDLKKRPDANLKHVIISEKVDKKAEKLQTRVLPYPFKDKEQFERSNRMPLGPEFNPAITIMELNRPEVVKKSGVSIKPIKLKTKK